MDVFSASGVSKQFSNHLALDDVSFSVPDQSIFGLLGPNGAGKTTFIRIINQILAPDTGTMYFNGQKLQPKHIAKIGYLPEERGLYKKMKVGEQALYLARLKGLDKHTAKERLIEWFKKFDILPWWNRKVEELSKGMQQKVQFIVTILHDPRLLIFDEPFSGFDPINVNLLKDEILNIRERGATIIFSTHNMGSVEELCDHIVLIDKSRKILEGNVKEVKQQNKLGLYEIMVKGTEEEFLSILPPVYELTDQDAEDEFFRAKIKVSGDISSNKLIEAILPHFEIKTFNEVLPTMNEIFIATVNNNNNKS